MYDYIKGVITYLEQDHIVIETGGIGYRIFCPHPSSISLEEKTILYLHHHVRDDAQLLYGFRSREERRMFRLLLEVSGIGPKGAMTIMASTTPPQLALAILHEDVKSLTKIPGIGPKTAKRLILDLKDKVKAEGIGHGSEVGSLSQGIEGSNAQPAVFLEALEALLVLGFQETEVHPLLRELMKEDERLTTDQLVKKALKGLNRFG